MVRLIIEDLELLGNCTSPSKYLLANITAKIPEVTRVKAKLGVLPEHVINIYLLNLQSSRGTGSHVVDAQ